MSHARTGSRQPNKRQYPQQEWRDVQHIIEHLYLEENRDSKYVSKYLRQEYRMEISERQLKTRFKTWGYADKKITGEEYRAMCYIMDQLGHEINFEVLKHNGRTVKQKLAADIRKEVRRQKRPATVSQPEWQNLEEAIEFLYRHNGRPQDDRFPSFDTATAGQPTVRDVLNEQVADEMEPDDSTSTTSTSSLPDIAGVQPVDGGLQDNSYQHRRPVYNLNNTSLSPSLRPRMWDQVPNPDAFTINLHESVLPQTAANQIIGGSEGTRLLAEPIIVPATETLDDLTLHLADLTLTFDSDDPRRGPWEKFLGIRLEQHYRPAIYDGHRLIVEFVAYYIQQTLAGFDTLDEYDHADRKEARAKLTQMLDAENEQVLTAINWISAVIGANDKGAQLSAFYEDCWACIENSNSLAARISRPSIRFALLMHGFSQRTPQNLKASPTARQRHREALAETFDGDKEFGHSIALLVQRGHQDSPTYLILRYQYAWFLLQKGQAGSGLRILLTCRQTAERLMGCNHLLTINCYAMTARAYEKEGKIDLAVTDLQIALLRFSNCPNPLRAYHHRLLDRLAWLQLGIGDYEPALCNLERVFEFRLQTLGPCSGSTWETANKLFPTLSKLGHRDEARRREEELKALHDAEWYRTRAGMI